MNINNIKQHYDNEIMMVDSISAIESIEIKYLGKKGAISSLMAEIKNILPEERREYGIKVNEMKEYIYSSISNKKSEMYEEMWNREIESAEMVDLTTLNSGVSGSLHPITMVQKEIEDIFVSMGFNIETDDEVVSDYENFQAVNVPADHPARDMQDTFYLDNGQVLKTHTSAMQNRVLRKYGAPLKAIFPGKCFRNESVDASHDNTFFQLEGMVVGENISISNLRYFIDTLLKKVLGDDIVTRLRPGYFPFVEPGMELDMQCRICGGKGCPTCKHSGWVEILPCGMIHPYVLQQGGIDTDRYCGFAFGLGLSRLAAMKYGINNIRQMSAGNVQVLKQFGY